VAGRGSGGGGVHPFSIGFFCDGRVRDVLLLCQEEHWAPAVEPGGRHTCFLTDQTSPHIAQLELRHRQRGRSETVIRGVKACGLDNMSPADVVNNESWAQLAATALNLCSWTRQLTLHDTGPARATPKTLRYKLFHTAGRHHGHPLDLDQDWAHTPTITTVLKRLDTRLPPHSVTNRQTA